MKDNYTYPAIFDYSEKGFINIEFPMFEGAFTCVESNEDAIKAAQEVLALSLQDCLDKNVVLPDEKLLIHEDEKKDKVVVYVNVWLPYHAKNIKETYVKKTLTIPMWLDILAKQNHINFSSVLVSALKDKLHIDSF